MPLVIFALLVSVPIIVWGSQLVIRLMDRFPIVITLGGMLLGWIAGSMIITDPAIIHLIEPNNGWIEYTARVAGALLVLAAGKWRASRVVVHEAVEEVEDDKTREEQEEVRKQGRGPSGAEVKQPDGAG